MTAAARGLPRFMAQGALPVGLIQGDYWRKNLLGHAGAIYEILLALQQALQVGLTEYTLHQLLAIDHLRGARSAL